MAFGFANRWRRGAHRARLPGDPGRAARSPRGRKPRHDRRRPGDVSPYTIVVRDPARIIRQLEPDDTDEARAEVFREYLVG